MSTLDELISDLAKKGKVNHITLSYSGTGKPDGHKYTAAFRDNKTDGYCMHSDADPIKALFKVLTLSGYKHYPGNKDKEPLPGKRSGRDLI